MNRKLVNGLLLLSVLTVGCGTFTSCKDNTEDIQDELRIEQELVQAMRKFLKLNENKPYENDQQYKDIYDLISGYFKTNGWDFEVLDPNGKAYKIGEQIALLNKINDFTYNDLLVRVLDNQASLETLLAAYDSQITSIEVSQAINNIFGTLNFPVGLQSNILGAYYGTTAATVKFPGDLSKTEVGGEVSDADLAKIATSVTSITLNEGENYMDNDGNLGRLYLTMNPADRDFTGASLQLINSLGEKAPVTLAAPVKNEDLLTFGWTRADNLLGLYRVDASIDPADAASIAPSYNSNELKNAFENAFKDPTKGDLVELGKVLLDQLNGFLPAYAVQATTDYKKTLSNIVKDTEGNVDAENSKVEAEENPSLSNNVYSKFEIAATAVHPLGFEFLSGVSTNKKLPTFGPVSDAIESILNDLKAKGQFNFESVEFKMGATSITVKLNGAVNAEGDPIDDIVLGYDPNKGTVSTGNETALNPAFGDLVGKVNGLLKDLQNNINGQMEDIFKDIENKLLGKASSADKLLAKYNQLASKINNFLANPNSALQVMLAYETESGIHRVSTDVNQPTFLKKGQALKLLTTTNTAEIVAPAYKKLVTVISDNKANASGASLNTIIQGRQHAVGFQASAAGLYKVAYTAVDYRGKTSTKVYYINVVD